MELKPTDLILGTLLFTHSHTSHLWSPDGRPGRFVPTASPVGTGGYLVHLRGTILE